MPTVTFAVPEGVKEKMGDHSWVNWSEVVRAGALNAPKLKEELLKQLESPEEKEFIEWSVRLGRKAKKGSFDEILSELPASERKRILLKR